MNDFIKLSIQFINGEIDADTYAAEYTEKYLADRTGARGNFPEAMLFTTIEHYNPADDKAADIDYPISDVSPVKVLTPSEVASLRKDLKQAHKQSKGYFKHRAEKLAGRLSCAKALKASPSGKPVKSSIHTKVLTPLEIQSLQQDKKQALKEMLDMD